MSKSIEPQQSINAIKAMAAAISEQQDYLSALDTSVGDGDHGHNMAKAMQDAAQQVIALKEPSLEMVWRTTGKAIQNSVGGASGLLFGAFFTGASRTLKNKEALTVTDIADMLLAGLSNVQKRGRAKPGHKTMVDALAPAVTAAQTAVDNNLSLVNTLQQVATTAMHGAESTKNMVAKRGRAKFLGERSKGFQDAGATSMAILLTAWANSSKT